MRRYGIFLTFLFLFSVNLSLIIFFLADLPSLVAGDDELVHRDGDGFVPNIEEDLIA